MTASTWGRSWIAIIARHNPILEALRMMPTYRPAAITTRTANTAQFNSLRVRSDFVLVMPGSLLAGAIGQCKLFTPPTLALARAVPIASPEPPRAGPRTEGTYRGSKNRIAPSPPCAWAIPRPREADRAQT